MDLANLPYLIKQTIIWDSVSQCSNCKTYNLSVRDWLPFYFKDEPGIQARNVKMSHQVAAKKQCKSFLLWWAGCHYTKISCCWVNEIWRRRFLSRIHTSLVTCRALQWYDCYLASLVPKKNHRKEEYIQPSLLNAIPSLRGKFWTDLIDVAHCANIPYCICLNACCASLVPTELKFGSKLELIWTF